MSRRIRRIATLLLVVALAGCAAGNTEKGAAIGAGAGAILGGIIGNQAGDTAVGAIMGAVVGGAAGAVIGNYMDRQAAELEQDLEGAEIERVGEGIKITFPSGLLFAVNDASLSPAARENLTSLGRVLNKYEDTNVLIEGHTDATGSEEYNQTLSERRARSVQTYLVTQGVVSGRLTPVGYGETQPVADNETESGRAANRRVEVAIIANEELREAAEKQAEKG